MKKITSIVLLIALLFSMAACGGNAPAGEEPAGAEGQMPEEQAQVEEPQHGQPEEIRVVAVAAGNSHTMALDNRGQLWAWGDNYYGQVGDGNISTYRDPLYEDISEYEEYAELIDGRVRNVDNDVYRPKRIMDDVKAIYACGDSSFAITNGGRLYAWGRNENGQLCDGTTWNKPRPEYIMDGVLGVDSTQARTIVLKADYSLWAYGAKFGTFGMGARPEIYEISIRLYENVKKAVLYSMSGSEAVLILTNDGRLISYEEPERYSGAYAYNERYNLSNAADISAASIARQLVYVLDADGNVYGWGANGFDGSLGANSNEFMVDNPTFIASDVREIYNGRTFVRNDGVMSVWGTVLEIMDYRDQYGNDVGGQLLGDLMVYGGTPVGILSNVRMAAEGGSHYIAVDNDGDVYTWGQNFNGQLGNGNSANQTSPMQIRFE